MYKRNNSSQNNKQQHTFEKHNQQHKYSSSSRNLRDIYSRSSGWLDVLYCLFVFLEGCLLLFVVIVFFVILPSIVKLLHVHTKQLKQKHLQQQSMYDNWISLYKVFPLWMLSPARGLVNGWRKSLTIERTPLPYYRNNSLTIQGNPLLWKESLPLL